MSRDPTLYIQDIRESCKKIDSYTRNMSFEEFATDARTIDAVARNLEVVGEAVKRLPPLWRENHPEIEWRKIAGLRDMLIHAYFGVDVEILWDLIQNKVPELHDRIQEMLGPEQEEPDAPDRSSAAAGAADRHGYCSRNDGSRLTAPALVTISRACGASRRTLVAQRPCPEQSAHDISVAPV